MYNNNGTATSVNITGGGAPVAGTWYHVVATYDGAVAKLYVNGAKVAEANQTSYVPGASVASRSAVVPTDRSGGMDRRTRWRCIPAR